MKPIQLYFRLLTDRGFNIAGISRQNYRMFSELESTLILNNIDPEHYILTMVPALHNWAKSKGYNGFVTIQMLTKNIDRYIEAQERAKQKGEIVVQYVKRKPRSEETFEESVKPWLIDQEYHYAMMYMQYRLRDNDSPDKAHSYAIGHVNCPIQISDQWSFCWTQDRNSVDTELVREAVDKVVDMMKMFYRLQKDVQIDPFADFVYEPLVQVVLERRNNG